MTNKEMKKLINTTAKAARKEFKQYQPADSKIIEINYGLPYVAVFSGSKDYFFQDEEAANLLEEATNTANKFNVSVENAILWQAQGW